MTTRRLTLAALFFCLVEAGCATRRSEDKPPLPEPHDPVVRLSYTAKRSHDPGRGFLQAIVEDPDGDLEKFTLVGPFVDQSRFVSGKFETLTAEVEGLPAGEHVYVGTATDAGGRTHADTLTIRVRPNHPPPSTLSVTGEGPWWRFVQHVAVDPQGDPVEYILDVEGPVLFSIGPRATPIDTTVTLPTGRYRVSSITSDGHATDTTTEDLDIVVRPPTASQSVERDGIVLRYRANVSAKHAALTAVRAPDQILYHGAVPLDTTFAGLTPGDDSGLPKGDYFFRLYGERHGHVLDETVWGHIIDLEPSVDYGGFDMSLHAGGRIVLPLPEPRDPNREDHPKYARATSLDGKVTLDLTDSTLAVEAVADSTGPFRVELVVGSATSGVAVDTLAATIHAHPAAVDTVDFKAGYGDMEVEGGATSVDADLKTDDETKKPIFDFDVLERRLGGLYRLKRRLNDRYGIAFGLDYSFLNQYSNFSTTDTQAASGIFRMFGTWRLGSRGASDWGGLVFRIENRHLVGEGITPRDLGFDGGSSISTATFRDFAWGLTELYWRQRLWGGSFRLAAGTMNPATFSGHYAFQTAYKFFLNRSFHKSPTVTFPQQGLGVVGRFEPVANWYVKAGLHDANGSPSTLGLDTFFEVREYYTWIEGGWTAGNLPFGGRAVHVNLWHQDPRESKGTEAVWGVTALANTVFDNWWSPFLRAGYSDGDGGQEVRFLVAGGVGLLVRSSDFVGIATSWSGPVDENLRNQMTSELIYRAQLTEHIAVSPGIQFTIHPSQTTETDYLAVASVLRFRIAL